MKKVYITRTVLLMITVCVIAILFYLYIPPQSNILETMNETIGKNKVDVVCVGSSHVFSGINPTQMYNEKGIAAYDIAIGSQAPWQSYYYIKEICKTQNPKVIVFDTYMLGTQDEDGYKDYQTVSNLLNCRLSMNKILAVLDSKADSKLSILLRFPYLYNRYDEYAGFTIDKLYGEKDYSFGYAYSDGIQVYNDVVDVSNVNETEQIDPKSEKYLGKIIDFCSRNSIQLVLTNTPWPCITEETQKKFNRIAEIADDKGVPFLDGCKCSSEIGMDYTVDSYGDGGHLNHTGVTKYTKWLVNYLSTNNSLPDRRGEPGYEAYGQKR